MEELEMHRQKEITAYRAIFDSDELAVLTDLSQGHSKLSQFEANVVDGPWIGANKRFPSGSIHQKPVTNVAAFGVFVELEPNVDGLIHSSRLPGDFRTNETFKRGNRVHVLVLSVDRLARRMELDWVPGGKP